MHISHTIPARAPSEPIRLSLTLLPTSSAIVVIHTTTAVRCAHGRVHLVPIDRTVRITSRSPAPLINACEDMIRYFAQGRADMADMLIGMALTDWVDPCSQPADDDPEIVEE